MSLPHITEKHRGVVLQLARTELVAAALFEHGAINNILDPESGSLVPSVAALPTWINTISRLSQVLGLTPMVNARVVQRGDGLLTALAGLDNVVDAETDEASVDTEKGGPGG